MALKIWLRVPLPEQDLASLRRSAPGCELRRTDDSGVDPQWLSEVEGVFTEEPLPEPLVEQMPNLRWLHVTRGGVNTYLTPAVKARPIQVTGSRGVHGTVFSEFALACIFAFAKKLPDCIEAQRQKHWQKLQPIEVAGQTLGIVGLGTAGNELARKAKALGMRVIATKRTVVEKPDFVDELGTAEFLPQLLTESDFVVLLLASVPTTFNIIGERELRMMKKSAYLVNLTGGRAIEESLLVRALKGRWIAGAASMLSRASRCPKIPSSGHSPTSSLPRASPASPAKNGPPCCRSSAKTFDASSPVSRSEILSTRSLVIDFESEILRRPI
jgi:phosphoglycerate dehydrogenase-like enzyme